MVGPGGGRCGPDPHGIFCKRHRARRLTAAGSLGDPGGEPPSDGNGRFHRPRRRDRQGRHRRAGPRLHRGAQFHRRASRSKRAISCSASSKHTYKAAVDQQNANLAKAKATEANANSAVAARPGTVKNQNIPQSTVDQRAADEQSAQADVMQAQALLEQAQINLGYTEIHSPIDGRIGLANFTVGNLVDPSSGQACDHRQPGSDLCHLSGERGRCHRVQTPGRRVRPKRTRM